METGIRHRWAWVPILLAGVAAYANSFGGAFLFDDLLRIVDNPNLRQLWPPWAAAAGSWRPVGFFTFALNHAISGTDPWSYHLTNLVIHLLAGLTLFGLLRRLLRTPPLSEFATAADGLALAITLLWLVHPMQTQAVTYVVQRFESLMGLLYLVLLYTVVRGADSPRGWPWYGLAGLAWVAGLGTKEVMATAPVVAVLVDGLLLSVTWGAVWRRRGALYAAMLAPILVVLLAWLITDPTQLDHFRGTRDVARLDYLRSQLPVLVRYLGLILWPVGQSLDHAWPLARTWSDWLPAALPVGCLVAATVWLLWRRSPAGLPGAWFLVILAPTSSLVPIRDLMVEHRLYLPSIAVLTVVVLGGWYLLARVSAGRRWMAPAAVAGAVIVLGTLTVARNQVYRSGLAMWSDVAATVEHNPRAHNNLGFYLADAGRLPEAIDAYETALRLRPRYPEAYGNLGKAWAARGDTARAMALFRQAIAVEEGYAEGHNNIGLLHAGQGRIDAARRAYETALEIDPALAAAHANLGVLDVMAGDHEAAEVRFRAALRHDPTQADALNNLGSMLFQRGELGAAIDHYRRAVAERPDYVDAHVNLGIALLRAGDADAALSGLERAVELAPASAKAHYQLADAWTRLGDTTAAVAHLRQTLRLRPTSTQVLGRLRELGVPP